MTERLLGLLIEFDEMGFAPTTVCEDSEGFAVKWKERLMKEIGAIEAENAALRERLEKAVELPCKIGDTIYYLMYFCDYKGCSKDERPFCGGCKEMIERCEKNEKYVICKKPFQLKDFTQIGKKYFTSREDAEARLEELKGGKQND